MSVNSVSVTSLPEGFTHQWETRKNGSAHLVYLQMVTTADGLQHSRHLLYFIRRKQEQLYKITILKLKSTCNLLYSVAKICFAHEDIRAAWFRMFWVLKLTSWELNRKGSSAMNQSRKQTAQPGATEMHAYAQPKSQRCIFRIFQILLHTG